MTNPSPSNPDGDERFGKFVEDGNDVVVRARERHHLASADEQDPRNADPLSNGEQPTGLPDELVADKPEVAPKNEAPGAAPAATPIPVEKNTAAAPVETAAAPRASDAK